MIADNASKSAVVTENLNLKAHFAPRIRKSLFGLRFHRSSPQPQY